MIYVISDIHGHEERFDSVMEQINLKADDTLYVLGDVIDRHKGGIRILRRLIAMPNVKMLLGNHEFMMMESLAAIEVQSVEYVKYGYCNELNLWYNNGGDITHNYWKRIRKNVREEVLNFLYKLPINFDVTVNGVKYILCHGSPLENYRKNAINLMRYDSNIEFAVWKRWSSRDGVPEGSTLIFGHTPTCNLQRGFPWSIFKTENAIGIDCGGAYDEGRLLCLRLDDMAKFYSEYTWDELFERALDKAFLSPELRAKDEARYQLGELIKKEAGYDIETCESAEEEIDKFIKKRKLTVFFDARGNIVRLK